jgi:hypothetical protein
MGDQKSVSAIVDQPTNNFLHCVWELVIESNLTGQRIPHQSHTSGLVTNSYVNQIGLVVIQFSNSGMKNFDG